MRLGPEGAACCCCDGPHSEGVQRVMIASALGACGAPGKHAPRAGVIRSNRRSETRSQKYKNSVMGGYTVQHCQLREGASWAQVLLFRKAAALVAALRFKIYVSIFIAFLLLSHVPSTQAECPNACSGHGYCDFFDMCSCFRGWTSGDCSERTCPWGYAFVPTPQGDLNMDGDRDDNSWRRLSQVVRKQCI